MTTTNAPASNLSPRQNTPLDVLVIGSVALDTVETPRGRREEIVGGSASYFAAAASLFTPVKMVAVVGEDFPQHELKFLQERGVDFEGLERVKGRTFRWTGRYSEDLQTRQTLATHLNVFESFRPKVPDSYTGSPILFLGNIDPLLQLEVRSQLTRPRLVALDTMNYWINGSNADLRRVLQQVDVLIINDEEVKELADLNNLVKAGRSVLHMGPRALVVKRGDSGALLFHGDQLFCVPAYPLEDVVDPTGAGDTFAGGFIGYMAEAGVFDASAIRRAMVYGCAAASFCVEAFGIDRLRELTRQEVDRRYGMFRALTFFEDASL